MLNNPEQELNENADDSIGTTEASDEGLDTEIDQDDQTPSDNTDDEVEALLYDIDGEETSLDTIREWKQGNMRQSDYTKGKQEIAEKRKSLDERSVEVDKKLEGLSALESRIEKLALAEVDESQLNELLETDPTEYLKAEQKVKKRKAEIEAIRKEITEAKSELSKEANRQLNEQLGWSDQEKYKKDVEMINKVRQELGINDHRFGAIVDPGIMVAFLEAAKYRELKNSNPKDTKKVTKVAKATRPKSAAPKPKTLAQRMYPNM